jgi:hypothetical protein
MDLADNGIVQPPAQKKTLLMGPKKLHPETHTKSEAQL